jgi:single-strand DNA-binding protein
MLIGNLGRDAETKFTPSGTSVTRFSVATTRRWQDKATGEWKDDTNWTNVVMWRAEKIANYLTKGKRVYVEGRLETRSYEDKDGQKKYSTEVVCDDLILLDGGAGGGPGGGGGEYGSSAGSPMDDFGGGGGAPVSMPRSARSAAKPMPQDAFDGGSDDDVPF